MDDRISPLYPPYISGLAHSIIGIARPVERARAAEGSRPGTLAYQARIFGRPVESAASRE
jgi:hypothetical protein